MLLSPMRRSLGQPFWSPDVSVLFNASRATTMLSNTTGGTSHQMQPLQNHHIDCNESIDHGSPWPACDPPFRKQRGPPMSALHNTMFSQPFWSPDVSVLFNASRAYALHWNLCKWLPMLQTKMQCCQCAAWLGCVPTSAS